MNKRDAERMAWERLEKTLRDSGLLFEHCSRGYTGAWDDPRCTYHKLTSGFLDGKVLLIYWGVPPTPQQVSGASSIVAAFDSGPDATLVNADSIRAKLLAAIATLEDADAHWGTPTLLPTQKDAALRLAVRAVAKLARLAAAKLDSD